MVRTGKSIFKLLICLSIIVISCSPSNNSFEFLTELIVNIEQKYSKEYIGEFSSDSEEEIPKYYFTIGKDIYNYVLNNNEITDFLKSKGIDSNNDITKIILTCWHRELNSKPIEIENEIKLFQNRDYSFNRCIQEKHRVAKDNYSEYEIGDTLMLELPIKTIENNFRVIYHYDCPSLIWVSDDKLLIKGTLIDKIQERNSGVLSFRISILNLNEIGVKYVSKELKVGGELDIILMLYGNPIKRVQH